MKKTLVALAVLAASGASFAQVTITGNLTMGYQSQSGGAANADASGFGVDTSQVNFAATEDLGGGMKATAKMALAGADRSGESTTGAVSGRDASLALQTGYGIFTLATAKAADYLSGGLAGVGAYYNGFDNKVLSARTSRDTVTYTLPVGAWALSATYQETADKLGLGAGTTGDATVTGQSLTGVVASYAAGKMAGNFTYLQFASQVGGNKNQTRLSGNYDFGAVKLGAGAVVTTKDVASNARITDMLVGLTVPVGAMTIGGQIVSRKFEDTGTINGTALEVGYALSKRTSLIGNYARWEAAVNANATTQYNLLVSHSF